MDLNGNAQAADRPAPGRFALKFFVGFTLLTLAFETSRGTAAERFIVEDLLLRPTLLVIHTLLPDDRTELIGRAFVSGSSQLRITRGCEGVEVFLMLLAAILAFPAPLAHKLKGVLPGAVLIFALAVARLAVLDYVLIHHRGAWESLHGFVLPLAPVILIGFFFMRWSARLDSASSAQDGRAA